MNKSKAVVIRACRGAPDAFVFLEILWRIFEVWDDLYDRDKPVTGAQINATMWRALVDLPQNRFYRDNMASLQPIIRQVIVNWQASNSLGQINPEMADILACRYYDLVSHVALLTQGPDAAAEVARDMWLAGNENAKREDHGLKLAN